ncbi:MAG: hypothetical protein IT437_12510 [Phycisphaerales bacterium]|nr:hypothetical protein [Phycisphaerales bacterium]
MRRFFIIAVAVVFGLALLSMTATYTIRFTEAGVLTTFGKADPESSVKREPGLYFKWPEPIQSITTYDTRARFLQQPLEQHQTLDDRQLVIEPYCTWRVSDPLKFFQRFSGAGDRAGQHYDEAARLIGTTLRSAMSETSRFRITELFPSGSTPSKIPDLEKRVLAVVQAAGLANSGVEVVDLGITRINFPEATTKEVMESMKAGRDALVQELKARGESEAQQITSAAEANASKIEAFARTHAAEIRQKGDLEAAQYIKQMSENPELAVFLKNIEFIRETLANRMTLFFSTNMPGFQLMRLNAMDDKEGAVRGVPGVSGLMETATPPTRPAEGRP